MPHIPLYVRLPTPTHKYKRIYHMIYKAGYSNKTEPGSQVIDLHVSLLPSLA